MARHSPLSDQRDLLGETPLWDARARALYWIDGRQGLVHRHTPHTSQHARWRLPGHIGSIALCESGRLLVALEERFGFLDPATGGFSPWGGTVAHAAAGMRLNDGRADRAGRFVVGSMVRGHGEALGLLYQLDGTGRLRVLDEGVRVANATCFSPDGRWLYFADSMAGQIWRYPYDPVSGQVGARAVFIDADRLGSAPDGATVDLQGRLWIALVLAGQLVCFGPDGQFQRRIDFPPDAYITCPCFGGDGLDTLYLTSIQDSGNVLRSAHPDAGAVFVIDGTGATGIEEARFDDRLADASLSHFHSA